MPRPVRIATFGGVRVTSGDVAISLGARSAEALLVHLALRRAPVTRGSLAALLWPDADVARARAALRSALRRIRSGLGGVVHVSGDTVALGHDVDVDAVLFDRHLDAGRLDDALELVAGDFLAGFDYPESPRFEAWVDDEAERYRMRQLAAHQELLVGALAAGDDARAIERAQRLLAHEPLHEPSHRVLMRLLERTGRRAEALRRHESFVELLRRELGLQPDPETDAVARALVEGSRPGTPDRAGGVAPTRARGGLPEFLGPFYGRGDAVSAIERRLDDPDCRWITVVGPGGAGKTRLVVEVARGAAARFRDGCVFVGAAGIVDPFGLLPTIGSRLGFEGPRTADAAADLAAALGSRRVLLIVDELEHVPDGAADLAALIRHAPGVMVVATSRVRLHLAEEWIVPLEGLETVSQASELFAFHARRAGGEVAPADPDLARIVAATGGLPLALELAATWANVLPAARIADSLERDLTMLEAPRPDLPHRHRSIERVFATTWEHLPADLRAVYPRLAPFRGSFGPIESELVAGADVRLLRMLVDRSLLRARDGRFELHTLTRHDALWRLEASGELPERARRHLHTYRDLAVTLAAGIYGSDFHTALGTFERERDNITAALAFGLHRRDEHEATARLLEAAATAWRARCSIREASTWLRRGLEMSGLEPHRRAALLMHLGLFAWMRGDDAEGRSHLMESLRLWDGATTEGRVGGARTRTILAMCDAVAGDERSAAATLDHARRVLSANDDPWWAALASGWAGRVAASSGRSRDARRDLELCLASYHELGSEWGASLFLGTLVELQLTEGDLGAARRTAVEAVERLEQLGFDLGLAAALRLRARVARADGEVEHARADVARADEIHERLGVQRVRPDVADAPTPAASRSTARR